MTQLIDFSKCKPEKISGPKVQKQDLPEIQENVSEEILKLTLNILVQNNPNKLTFTLKEAAQQMNVGEEFLRRRVKSGIIKTIYMGDKPMIQITELARLLAGGTP